jgi:probable F420-dependent oxidoreductase
MKVGAIFPHFEFGNDPAAIRDYAQTVEDLGYSHIGADDHVIGPNPNRPGGWTGWVTYQVAFHEPFVLFGFMAAVTKTVEFSTCVLLLPQRQTVLVAKQSAELDILSQGRLRLGIGNGWSEVEYIALGKNFHNRGHRIEEQILILKQLWQQPLVNYYGYWHTIPDAGINPLPMQRPIPIWFGGQAEPVLERMARLGDGWMPLYADAEEARPSFERLEGYLDAAGRSRENFGLEARLHFGKGDIDRWLRLIEGWQRLGATHLSIITTNCGFENPAGHLSALAKFASEIGIKTL